MKPSHWYIQTGTLSTGECYNQYIHNFTVNTCNHHGDWKQKLFCEMQMRNRNMVDGNTYYYTEGVLYTLWKEAVERIEICPVCLDINDMRSYIVCDNGHRLHNHCPNYKVCNANKITRCPICQTSILYYKTS